MNQASLFKTKQASLFNAIMIEVWGDDTDWFMAKAIADKLRGMARINPENAMEVLAIVFPDATITLRERNENTPPERHVFNVRFVDETQCLIVCDKYGRGDEVELL